MVSLSAWGNYQIIKPIVADRFGQVIAVEASFIDKPNDYHSQNIVKEPYLISIIKVNGKTLPAPIIMEYISVSDLSMAKKGQKYKFEAYETVYTWGEPFEWDQINQSNYQIIHRMVIRETK
jgi:hypothetical protein